METLPKTRKRKKEKNTMSTIFGLISSNLFKKSIPLPLYASISINPLQFHKISCQKLATAQCNRQPSLQVSGLAHDPTYVPEPGNSPPDIPRAPPAHNLGLPPEVPRRHNVPDFDPIPPEKPVPPPPTGPDPEYPGPPDPVPPKPEVPPPPGEPEVVPPGGPEITPVKPPEPSPTIPGHPDAPPPIIGSNGLVFY